MTGGAHDAWVGLERSAKVPEILARELLRSIVREGLEPGDRLPSEADMLAAFGVGRASVREALRILETHGLIRMRPGPGGGPIIASISARDYARTTTVHLHRCRATFREVLEARLAVEPLMAGLAARRLTPATAERLQRVAQQGWDAVDTDQPTWSEAMETFHDTVAAASGNGVLDLYSGALIRIEWMRVGNHFADRARREPTLHTHDRIVEAIAAGDTDRAHDLSRRHMEALAELWRSTFPKQLDSMVEWQ